MCLLTSRLLVFWLSFIANLTTNLPISVQEFGIDSSNNDFDYDISYSLNTTPLILLVQNAFIILITISSKAWQLK
jgi:hypothetical protein